MTVRHLKTFIAVCESGGITKAASALYVAQPAVSQTIAEIEKHYNVILFDRIGNRLVLTDCGKRLLAKAKETVASFDDFEHLARESETNTDLHMGASLTIGRLFVPQMVAAINRELPQIRLSVTIQQTSVIEGLLVNGSLDFAFVEGSIHSNHLITQAVFQDRLTAVSSCQFAVPKQITLEELTKYPLLLREPGSASRDFLNAALSVNHLTATPTIESASNQALIACAAAGNGIAVLPQNLMKKWIEQGKLKTITITNCDFDRDYLLAYHKNKRFYSLQEQAFSICRAHFIANEVKHGDYLSEQ